MSTPIKIIHMQSELLLACAEECEDLQTTIRLLENFEQDQAKTLREQEDKIDRLETSLQISGQANESLRNELMTVDKNVVSRMQADRIDIEYQLQAAIEQVERFKEALVQSEATATALQNTLNERERWLEMHKETIRGGTEENKRLTDANIELTDEVQRLEGLVRDLDQQLVHQPSSLVKVGSFTSHQIMSISSCIGGWSRLDCMDFAERLGLEECSFEQSNRATGGLQSGGVGFYATPKGSEYVWAGHTNLGPRTPFSNPAPIYLRPKVKI